MMPIATPKRPPMTRGQIASVILLVICAGPLWALLVASFKLHEMLVGLFAVVLTVTAASFVTIACRSVDVRLRVSDVAQVWRLPYYLVQGSAQILITLARDVLHIHPADSLFRAAPFEAQHDHDPVQSARRVLAVAYTSATPNFIIIGIDRETSTMLFHQLEKSDVPEMTRKLGAQA